MLRLLFRVLAFYGLLRAIRRGPAAGRTPAGAQEGAQDRPQGVPVKGRLALIVLTLALAVPGNAAGATFYVDGYREFNAAVARMGDRGGTVVLRRGQYGPLQIGPRSADAGWLTVRARPGAVTRLVEVHGSRRVRLVRLTISNFRGRRAYLDIHRSRQVAVLRARVRGQSGLSARASVTNSRDVTVRNSLFRRTRGVSLRVLDSARVTFEGNRFLDCFGCDFLYVRQVDRLTVRNNTFDRAVPGPCGLSPSCNHQDILQGSGGRRWLIEGNRFGVSYPGAAQIYISGFFLTDNVTIRGNTFLRDDPSVPGMAPWTGMVIGQPTGWVGLPRNVRIEGNTILSGYPRPYGHWAGVGNSIILTEQYAALPPEERPIVAGNVLATTTHPELLCGMAREATGNLTESGEPVC